jgi:hypothetical protein
MAVRAGTGKPVFQSRWKYGYDGSTWPHHDGFKWLHSVDNWTVQSGP